MYAKDHLHYLCQWVLGSWWSTRYSSAAYHARIAYATITVYLVCGQLLIFGTVKVAAVILSVSMGLCMLTVIGY